MKNINLANGKGQTFVDDIDFEYLKNFSWRLNSSGYARNGKDELMHRIIYQKINPGFKGEIDHIDGNKLNNTRSNLRPATRSQQGMNRKIQSNNTSGFTGVSFLKERNKWELRVEFQGKKYFFGHFNNEDFNLATKLSYCLRKFLFGKFFRENTFKHHPEYEEFCDWDYETLKDFLYLNLSEEQYERFELLEELTKDNRL